MPDPKVNPKEGENDDSAVLKQLAEGMTGIIKRFDTIEESVSGLTTQFKDLTNVKPDPSKAPDPDPDKGKSGIPDDIETLDRTAFLGVIMEQVKGAMQESISEVNKDVSSVRSNIASKNLREEIEGLMSTNKDFQDWLPEMKAIANENPSLSATRIYSLAKAENPDKLKELNEKTSEESGKQEKTNAFGSLTPTSGVTKSDSSMSSNDAANSAFDEVFGGQSVGDGG